jgi:predicted acetyltransferase
VIVRELTDGDDQQRWDLAMLAFGGDPAAPVQPAPPGRRLGVFDERGLLLGSAVARPYTQWWHGQPVPMAGIAAVAVRPEFRGRGLVKALLDEVLAGLDDPLSVLFPTAPGIYRRLGWEIVGSLDDTVLPLSALPQHGGTGLRPATEADLPELAALYADRGRAGSGLLTRTGPGFVKGPGALLERSVLSVAVEDGGITGYLAYDRGRGYHSEEPLKVWELLSSTPTAARSLLASLAGWSAVTDRVSWRGPTADLARQLDARLPPPATVQPWMLRVVNPVEAIAARGFAAGTASLPVSLAGTSYRLEVDGGRGQLTPVPGGGGVEVSATGLALLYAGIGRGLASRGLADGASGELEAVFAGPQPEILDYF